MNKYSVIILPIYLVLSNCAISPSSAADIQIVTSVQNGYQIELVASESAYLNNIHIKSVENGLQVTGLVTHQIHQAIRIRGHVEVEILDAQGKIVKQMTATINPQQSEPARRTHSRPFSVIIPGTVSKEYRILVRHHIGGEH
jgi:hypothetical protein